MLTRRWLLGMGLGLVLVASARASSPGKPLEPVERSDDDVVILELRLERLVLNDAVLAYLDHERLLLPLTDIVTTLELPIEVDPGSGVAKGWFLRENRRFSLDLGRGEVYIEGVPGPYDETLVELHADDVYVDKVLLQQWFPVDFDVDLLNARITLRSREKLPIEQKIARRRTWERLRTGSGAGSGGHHPDVSVPYRFFAWPALDARLQTSFEESAAGLVRRRSRSTLLAAGDFLFMSTELALGLQQGDVARTVSEARLKMSRSDPEGRLLGRLGASELKLGDILTPRRPLVSGESYSRGVEISNFPLDRPEEFDRTTVRGDALPGWEAELYHNEELIDFQAVGEEGHYEFTGVPLYVGLNLLRVVLHGPQGQRRETLERVLIDEGLIRRGESFYRLAVHQNGERLLPVEEEIVPGGPESHPGELRLFAEWERGLRRDLSLTAHVQSLPLETGRHTYAGLGLLATRRGVLYQLNLVGDVEGGWAGRLTAEGQLRRANFRLEHRRFFDFVSEEASVGDPLVSFSALQLDLRLRQPGGLGKVGGTRRWPLRFSVTASGDRRRSGDRQSSLNGRLSTSWRRISFTHGLELRDQRLRGASSRTLSSALLLSGRFGKLRLRGGLVYRWQPRPRFTDISLSADWRWSPTLSSRFSLVHSLSDENTFSDPLQVDRPSQLTANLSRRFRSVALSAGFSYQDTGALRVDLSASFSLLRQPFSRRFRPSARSGAQGGALAARVFLDRNHDGRFDPDSDEPLEGVRFKTYGGGQPARTDARGRVMMSGLEARRRVEVELDEGSLEDPYWVPRREGVGFVPRPGRTVNVEFPVTMSGEVDGTVYLERGAERIPISKVRLQLVDADGAVIREAASTYDGFYLLEKIPPGRYRLRLDEEQRRRLGLRRLSAREITVGDEGDVVSGVDFVVEREMPVS